MNRRSLVRLFLTVLIVAVILIVTLVIISRNQKKVSTFSERVYQGDVAEDRITAIQGIPGVYSLKGVINGGPITDNEVILEFEDGTQVMNELSFKVEYLDREDKIQTVTVPLLVKIQGKTIILDRITVADLNVSASEYDYRVAKIIPQRVVNVPFLSTKLDLELFKANLQSQRRLTESDNEWFNFMEKYLESNEDSLASFAASGTPANIVIVPVGASSSLYGENPVLFNSSE